MKKKLFIIMLLCILLLVGCGKDKDEEGSDDGGTTETSVDSGDVSSTDNSYIDNDIIDFDIGEPVVQEQSQQSTTNMLPQSSTASKFTGETQSSGFQHSDVSQNNFHHIGQPVVTTAKVEEIEEEQGPVEDTNAEEEKEEQNKPEKADRAEFETLYDGTYIADDFEDDQIYILISMGDDWSYECSYANGDKYSNNSEEDNRAVVFFNMTGIELVNITGCAMLYISDESVEAVAGDEFSNGIFRCGIDFDAGAYNFVDNGGDYYIAIYRNDDSMSSMKNKPLAGVTYNTELEDGDYVYIASGVNMVRKEEAEDE